MSRIAPSVGVVSLLVWGVWAQAAAQVASSASSYRIGPKDLVEIQVFEEEDLNVTRRVSGEGSINLPLLGEVRVEGLTQEELAGRLKDLLEAQYLQRASVAVQVTEYRSKPISVIGAVKRPGILELSGRWTLLETLTEAGGLDDRHANVVYVLRRADNGLSDQLRIDLDDLLVRADPTVNVPIFANDVVNVPAASEVTVFCLGQVTRPGALTFQSTERITLLAALAKAGGLTERASHKIRIKRSGPGSESREIIVRYKRLLEGKDPDLELQEGDLVIVKESFF